ncbi:MAG: TIGR00730 family Rossman fold protein [Paracoccaceae bacterium]|nr:TIGR00730 family Rossman fold protein [Paracoccaceae bacterium]
MQSTYSVCVYCGSRSGNAPAYTQAARDVGALIAAQGWRLVYGAGDIGLMGEVAKAAQTAGAEALGVIPHHLTGREPPRAGLTTLIVTETMHERKKVMFMNSHATVVMPGGAGTMDEFFEMLTWRQIGLHSKPVFLLNINGYWDPLVKMIDHVVDEGFAEADLRDYTTVVPDVPTLERLLRTSLS